MSEPLGYSLDGDIVTLRMTFADFSALLFSLGYAAGSAKREGNSILFKNTAVLVNRINVGNLHFIPYEVQAQRADPA